MPCAEDVISALLALAGCGSLRAGELCPAQPHCQGLGREPCIHSSMLWRCSSVLAEQNYRQGRLAALLSLEMHVRLLTLAGLGIHSMISH